MPRRLLVTSSFAFVLALGFTAPVRSAAAAPPSAGPEEEACQGRAVGDACTLPNNQLGTCANATCNRLDYSGGSPPKATEEACVVCQAAGAGQPHGGPPMLGGDGGSEPEPVVQGGGADKAPGAGKEPPESSSRCRVDDHGAPPAGLALLAGLLALGLRRRPRGK